MPLNDDIYRIADELRGVASLGLHYAENPYDKERYEQVLRGSARLVAALEHRPAEEVLEQYEDNLSHMSRLIGAEAAVFRDGRILLIRREDDGRWAMPGGAAEVGETLAESAERELREEAGVAGHAAQLLGIFDSRLWGSLIKSQVYNSVFLVDDAPSSAPVAGPETTDVGFFAEDELPDLSPGHHRRVPITFRLALGELPVPYFDPVYEVGSSAQQGGQV